MRLITLVCKLASPCDMMLSLSEGLRSRLSKFEFVSDFHWPRPGTVGAPAKKHPVSLQGTLLDFDGFTKGNARFLCPKSIDFLGYHVWVSCGGFFVAEPPL